MIESCMKASWAIVAVEAQDEGCVIDREVLFLRLCRISYLAATIVSTGSPLNGGYAISSLYALEAGGFSCPAGAPD